MSAPIPYDHYRCLAQRLTEETFGAHDGADALIVRTPWTGEVLGSVPCLTPADVQSAVLRGRAAQPGWAARPFAERAQIVKRFHDMLLAREATILDLMQLETGKARKHALEEILDTAIVARHYSIHGERYLRAERRRGALPVLTSSREYRHPRGLVGVIAPWNYPLSLAITDALPALLAGNAIILKPDSQTPFTALWAVRLLVEAGLPADVFQVVTGAGAELGPALIDGVDYVTFTGSTATGRVVARQAAERLIGCSLELGGKNAMLVLDDANLGMAVEGALLGCFASAGQLCVSIERIFVHQRLYSAFLWRFAERTRALRLGVGFGYDIEMGSLVGARQLSTVSRHVEDAVAKGAEVEAGGRARPDIGPYFYEPTILAGVTPAMEIYDEETFGPVVAVYPVASAEEAIASANASRYGLNASVWTRNLARGRAVAQRLQAGTVNVNEAYAAAWGSVDATMGGVKDSGLGRRHGAEGMQKYTEPQTVAVQRLHPIDAPWGFPRTLYARAMIGYLRVIRHIPGLR
ncbi:MAG: succinate-semialdehyde dehydrogenase (NADP(+)) [Kouleothrix sp.]|nr:succinate-semialdehyde dehydrogenase (NADP(+)) [Kouleothrix sp.]